MEFSIVHLKHGLDILQDICELTASHKAIDIVMFQLFVLKFSNHIGGVCVCVWSYGRLLTIMWLSLESRDKEATPFFSFILFNIV